MNSKINSILFHGTFGICFIYVVGTQWYNILMAGGMIPGEVREFALLKLANDFASGINPYIWSVDCWERPLITNVYGMVLPMILSLFYNTFPHVDMLLIADAGMFLVELISVLSVSIVCFRKNAIAFWLSNFFLLACYWRYGAFGGAFPDHFGLAFSLFLMLFIIVNEKNDRYYPLLYASVIILMFHTKAYFLLNGVGIFFLLLLKNLQSCIKYCIYLLLGFLITGIALNEMFPLYFTETFALVKVMDMSHYSLSTIRYSLEQIGTILKSPFVVVMLLYIHWCFRVWKDVRNRDLFKFSECIKYILKKLNEEDMAIYPVIQFFIALLPVVYISQNRGAFEIYYLQLCMPYLIYIGLKHWLVIEKEIISMVCHKGQTLSIVTIMLLTGWFSIWNHVRAVIYEQEDIDAYDYAYEFLADQLDGEILVPMHLSGFCIKNGIYTDNYGQADCSNEDVYRLYMEDGRMIRCFPELKMILESNINYRHACEQKMKNGEYSIIVVTDAFSNIKSSDIDLNKYKLEKRIKMRTGSEQKWDTYFYKRK